MKLRCLPIVVMLYLFAISPAVKAEEGKYYFRACVEKSSQAFCPGSADIQFSDKQMLFYRYNKPSALKQAKIFYNKAVHYENRGKLDFARLYYIKAVDTYPYLIEAYINLGGIYICLGQYDLAISTFQKVSSISSDYYPALYVNLGLAYEGKKDYVRAREYYELAIDIDPTNVLAHNNIACVYFKMGEPEQALEHLRIVDTLSPGFLKDEISNIIANN